MNRYLIVIALLLAAPAFARQDHTCQGGHNCNSGGGGDSTSNSSSQSAAKQQQQQQQAQQTNQQQTANASLININGAPAGAGGGVGLLSTSGADDGGSADGISVLSPTAAGGTGSSGDVSYNSESDYFSMTIGAANIDGCMTGKGAGGAGGGGGGWINWAGLNIPCFLNEMAEAERHVKIRARLKCGAKPFREAMIFDDKGMKKVERIQACIDFVQPIWLAEIDYLKQLATDRLPDAGAIKGAMLLADAGNAQLEQKVAVLEAELEAERRHQQVQSTQQQQIQQQQIQNEAEIGVKVIRAEQRRANANAYLERMDKRNSQ